MTTDDIVERIRKLMRLAENAAATEAEAASALERANALLMRHNLTMDRVAVSVGDKPAVTEQRVRTGRARNWRGSLLGILARHNLSSPIIARAESTRSSSYVDLATYRRPMRCTTGSPPSPSASPRTDGGRSTKSNARQSPP